MPYLNKVQLIGNLGKDPEIRVSPTTGSKQVSFSLATSRRYRDANGEQKEDTQWHNIVGWGKVAEVFEQLGVRKGTSLYVEGRLTNRSWTDQASGQKRYVTEVALDTFQILTPRQAQNGNGYGAPQQQRTTYQQPQAPSDDDDIDLPF
jgi:single-strand DNA-binding protein